MGETDLHEYIQVKTPAALDLRVQPIQAVSHSNYHGILHTITW